MRRIARFGLVGTVIIGLVVTVRPAVTRSWTRPPPARVSQVRLGPRVRVGGGGRPWVGRSWRQLTRGGNPTAIEDCLQVGQLAGSRLVRNVYGRERVMRMRDRSVCGSTALRPNEPVDPEIAPILVERLLRRSGAGSVVLTHTIVAGILPSGIRGVALDAAGRRVPVRFDRDTRAFLAVLPGSIRRRDLVLAYLRPSGRQVVDFGSGRTGAGDASPIVRGSLQTPIVIDATGLATPLALVVYRVRDATVHGSQTEPCAEPAG